MVKTSKLVAKIPKIARRPTIVQYTRKSGRLLSWMYYHVIWNRYGNSTSRRRSGCGVTPNSNRFLGPRNDQRRRKASTTNPPLHETPQRTFGKECVCRTLFFINGNMTVGPWKGSLIVRLAKNSAAKALTRNFKTDTSVYQLSRAKN